MQQEPAEENRGSRSFLQTLTLGQQGARGSEPGTSQGSEDQSVAGSKGPPAQFPLQQPSRCLPSTVRKVTHSSPHGGCSHRAQAAEEGAQSVGAVPPLSTGRLPGGPCLPHPCRGCPWAYYRPVQLLKIVPVCSQNQ